MQLTGRIGVYTVWWTVLDLFLGIIVIIETEVQVTV